MGDPQRGAGREHLWGWAQAASILTRGRASCDDIEVCQRIPPLPLVARIDADHAFLTDGTPDGWRDARELQLNVPFPLQHQARGIAKPRATVGEPPVERLAHKILGHPSDHEPYQRSPTDAKATEPSVDRPRHAGGR